MGPNGCPYCFCLFGWKSSKTTAVCRDCRRQSDTARWGSQPKQPREEYSDGTHGAKKREQKRLKTSGATYESEHVVGYEVFARGLERGGSQFARTVENHAPAYQEARNFHRAHIGTGTWKHNHPSGDSSQSYRDAQRRLMEAEQAGNAVQLNQRYYAHQPGFSSKNPDLAKADDSFQSMAKNAPHFPLWEEENERWRRIVPTPVERAEMSLARMTARSGRFPSVQDELDTMREFNILPSRGEKLKHTPSLPFTSDINGIPMDGNCLFHSIWAGLNSIHRDGIGFVSNDMLRQQAVGYLRHDPGIQALGVVNAEYLQTMGQNGTWGGELEALALAYVWGVRITVVGYQGQNPSFQLSYNQSAREGFTIHYYREDSHYTTRPLSPLRFGGHAGSSVNEEEKKKEEEEEKKDKKRKRSDSGVSL
jgi:Agrobacterium VirD5 protein/OTU-like cysteine protease